MNRALTYAVFLVSAVTAQQQIPTGGRIPARRGFNNSVDDPKSTSRVEEVVRKVAGNVYVIQARGETSRFRPAPMAYY